MFNNTINFIKVIGSFLITLIFWYHCKFYKIYLFNQSRENPTTDTEEMASNAHSGSCRIHFAITLPNRFQHHQMWPFILDHLMPMGRGLSRDHALLASINRTWMQFGVHHYSFMWWDPWGSRSTWVSYNDRWDGWDPQAPAFFCRERRQKSDQPREGISFART